MPAMSSRLVRAKVIPSCVVAEADDDDDVVVVVAEDDCVGGCDAIARGVFALDVGRGR